jgi:hypothetical protein
MSPREVLHRLREQALRRRMRGIAGKWPDPPSAEPVALPALTAMLAAPWPDDLTGIMKNAAMSAAGGNFRALGVEWPQVSVDRWTTAGWFFDPVTQKRWPGAESFAFDINYRHTENFGDVKYVWEPNRLQFLLPVAAVAVRENDPRLARFAIDTTLAWLDANPPLKGVNWNSGIEIALRLVSLAIVVAALHDRFQPGECLRLAACIEAHAQWLERFPSLHSSANNHRIAEGLGLIVAAKLLPSAAASARRLAEGRAVLVWGAGSQFHEDGIGAEQSPTYAAFTLEMLCLGARLLAGSKHALDPDWKTQIGRAGHALAAFCDGSGLAPRIGDDDEGRVIGTSLIDEPRYVASVAALAAAVAEEASPGMPPRDPSLRDGLAPVGPVTAMVPSAIQHFPQGGYTLVRDRIADRPFELVFDHGPLGYGAIAAHGHADALSVWLRIAGREVFVDAGTYLYHSGGVWREFFRSTAAHNTLELNASSQSLTAGAFNWRKKARAWCVDLDRTENAWSVEAGHDGYRGRYGAVHLRRISRSADGVRIEDRLTGLRTAMPVTLRFLIHPDIDVVANDDTCILRLDGNAIAHVQGPAGFELRIRRGEGVGPGWYSPSFGRKTPTACLEFHGNMDRDAMAATSILPGFPAA